MVTLVVFLNLFFVPVIALWLHSKRCNEELEASLRTLVYYAIFCICHIRLLSCRTRWPFGGGLFLGSGTLGLFRGLGGQALLRGGFGRRDSFGGGFGGRGLLRRRLLFLARLGGQVVVVQQR